MIRLASASALLAIFAIFFCLSGWFLRGRLDVSETLRAENAKLALVVEAYKSNERARVADVKRLADEDRINRDSLARARAALAAEQIRMSDCTLPTEAANAVLGSLQ